MKAIEFFNSYKTRLFELMNSLDETSFEKLVEALVKAEKNQSKIVVIGNGGSASTASHMANDLGTGLRRRKLRNFDIVSLCDNASIVTAMGNDIGFENVFYMQMEGLVKEGDLVIAISCSGNSPNIVKAVEHAKEHGAVIIGATGFEGGKLKELSDINFHVPSERGEYGVTEDIHMILDHLLFEYFLQDSAQ